MVVKRVFYTHDLLIILPAFACNEQNIPRFQIIERIIDGFFAVGYDY